MKQKTMFAVAAGILSVFFCVLAFAGHLDDPSQYVPTRKPDDASGARLYRQYLDNSTYYLNEDLYEEAKQLLWRAIEINPADPDAYVNLAVVSMREKDHESALRLFDKAETCLIPGYQQTEILFYNKAVCLYELARYPDAAVYFNKALSVYPDFPEALLYSGLVSQQLSLGNDAYFAIFKARYLFQRDKKSGLEKTASERLSFIEQNSLTDRTLLATRFFDEGKRLLEANDLDQATEFLERSIAFDPQSVDAYIELAELYARNGAYHNAIMYLNRVVEADPQSVDGYMRLGHAYRALENHDMAVRCFRKASEINASDPLAYYNMALVYEDASRHNTAKKYLTEARKRGLKANDPRIVEKVEKSEKRFERKQAVYARPLRSPKPAEPAQSSGSLYPYHPIAGGNAGNFGDGYFVPNPKVDADKAENSANLTRDELSYPPR